MGESKPDALSRDEEVVVRLTRFGLSKRHRLGLEPQRHKGARRSDCSPRELYRAMRGIGVAVMVAHDEDNEEDLRMALLNLQLIGIEFVRRLEHGRVLKVIEDEGLEILKDRVLDRVERRMLRILEGRLVTRSGECDDAPEPPSAEPVDAVH